MEHAHRLHEQSNTRTLEHPWVMSFAERLSDTRVNGSDDMGLNYEKALQWYHKTQAYMGRNQKLVIDEVRVVFL